VTADSPGATTSIVPVNPDTIRYPLGSTPDPRRTRTTL
jgi:hypothetical protein